MNDDALDEVARELGLDRDEVEKVLRSHKKHKGRLKQIRNELKRRAIAERTLGEAKKAHPEKCFCKEEGHDPDHDPNKDVVFRHVTCQRFAPFSSQPTGETYQKPIYRCRRCGKEWELIVLIATNLSLSSMRKGMGANCPYRLNAYCSSVPPTKPCQPWVGLTPWVIGFT